MELALSAGPAAYVEVARIRKAERLGVPFLLILIYFIMDYARPANPMKIPLGISIALFVSWVLLDKKKKRWSPQAGCFLVLLGAIGVGGVSAQNNYAAFWGFVAMTSQLLLICVPMMTFISSLRKMTIFVNTMLVVFVYVALYGLLHEGRGPGGHIGDENDLALALNMVIPYAYMSMFFADRASHKMMFLGAFCVMTASVIATFSRGGFLGLVAVLAFGIAMSPRKKLAITAAAVLGLGILLFTPSSYWSEMGTIASDAETMESGTGALRREFWGLARSMFYANPVLGVGVGNFPWTVALYESPDRVNEVGRSYAGVAAHSVYFTVLAELGLAGVITFFLIVKYNIRDTRRVIKWHSIYVRHRSRDGERRFAGSVAGRHDLDKAACYARAMQASMLAYLVSGVFLSVFDYPHFWTMTAVTVALRHATAEMPETGSGASAGPRPSGAVPGAAHPATLDADWPPRRSDNP